MHSSPSALPAGQTECDQLSHSRRWPRVLAALLRLAAIGLLAMASDLLASTAATGTATVPATPVRLSFLFILAELYDLRTDPGQVGNVASRPEYASTKATLKKRLATWMRETGDPRTDPRNDGPESYRYWGDVNTWDKDNFDGAHLFGK